ncbi:MAG: SH3 domain-containing protein [Prevotella sp.]|nr:SH3 domain-containing protein [Prevotella sp.]
MKKLLSLAFGLVFCLGVNAQSMKMVVSNQGEVQGRYVRTNASTYTVDVQDEYDIPKAGNKVVTFSAAKGQGIVYRKGERVGNINVRKGPSTKTAVVGKIVDPEGVPDTFPCLGKVNGWYKIRINGKVGYVREDMVNWDGMDTF